MSQTDKLQRSFVKHFNEAPLSIKVNKMHHFIVIRNKSILSIHLYKFHCRKFYSSFTFNLLRNVTEVWARFKVCAFIAVKLVLAYQKTLQIVITGGLTSSKHEV